MDKENERLLSEKNFRIARNFIDKLDILMELQDKSEDNEAADLVRFTRSSRDLKIHFLLDDTNYRVSAEKVFDNYFNTFVNANTHTISEIKYSLYNSYSSLFRVIEINENRILLEDLLLSKNTVIINQNVDSLEEGDFLFARLAKFNSYNFVIHVLNILNDEIGEIFYNMIFEFTSINIKNIINENRKILILKESLIDIFIVFGMAIKSYEELNTQIKLDIEKENIKINFFDEEDIYLFENFIDYIEDTSDFEEDDIYYFLEIIYSEFLEDIGENFSHFNNYSYVDIFTYLCENGSFLTNTEFYNSIYIIKKLYLFFEKNKRNVKKSIKELNSISSNIFYYQNLLQQSINGFYFDEGLLNIIPYNINAQILKDFEEFIKYIELMNVVKSENKDMLIPTHIKNLSDDLNLNPTKNIKNLNQNHYPLLNLFYNFAKTKQLIEIDNIYILPANRINKYLSLTNEDKYALFVYNILNDKFIKSFVSNIKFESFKNTLINLIEYIIENNKVNMINLNLKNDKLFILDGLIRLNIIDTDSLDNIYITDIGKNIYNYYLKEDNKSKIISLDKYKKDLE